jgi:saccharopine dehydrogenase-like NADP-dependent oxidoreductase
MTSRFSSGSSVRISKSSKRKAKKALKAKRRNRIRDEQPPLDDDTKEQYYGAEEEEEYEEEEEISLISELPGIPGHIVETLKAKGVLEIVDLLNMEDADLESIPGLNEDDVLTIKNIIAETVEIIEEDDEDDDE